VPTNFYVTTKKRGHASPHIVEVEVEEGAHRFVVVTTKYPDNGSVIAVFNKLLLHHKKTADSCLRCINQELTRRIHTVMLHKQSKQAMLLTERYRNDNRIAATDNNTARRPVKPIETSCKLPGMLGVLEQDERTFLFHIQLDILQNTHKRKGKVYQESVRG